MRSPISTCSSTSGPIDQRDWPRDHWHAALRATGVRPRKFYATRHTFISVALTNGVNVKWLAERCGTSVAMIEKHYGKFLEGQTEAQLRLLMGPVGSTAERRVSVAPGPKPATLRRRFPVRAEKRLWDKASPTGFEPVGVDEDGAYLTS